MTITTDSAARSANPAAAAGARHTAAILAIILISCFMILLDNSIIFTALPNIHAAMRFSGRVRRRGQLAPDQSKHAHLQEELRVP